MSLESYIEKRKKEVEGKIPLSKLYKSNTFVDCKACDYVYSEGENILGCGLTKTSIPDEVVPLGCDKGKEDSLPF